jgi:DNA-binding NarL/FixJ family response regulator
MTEYIKVILADDHAVVRAGIRQFLEQSGKIQVLGEASDGLQACQLIEQLQPEVAVLDIQMPGKNGVEVTRWVRANHLTTGVLILSAFDEEPYVQAALKAGANGYVVKTAEIDEIIQAVEDVSQGKAVLDARLKQRHPELLEHINHNVLKDALSERELEVLGLVGRGLTNKSIAVQLKISEKTVQNHLAHIFEKLEAASRTEAVMRAITLGLLSSQ